MNSSSDPRRPEDPRKGERPWQPGVDETAQLPQQSAPENNPWHPGYQAPAGSGQYAGPYSGPSSVSPEVPSSSTKGGTPWGFLALLALLALAFVGAGAWYFLGGGKETDGGPEPQPVPAATSSVAPTSKQDAPAPGKSQVPAQPALPQDDAKTSPTPGTKASAPASSARPSQPTPPSPAAPSTGTQEGGQLGGSFGTKPM